MIKPETPEEQQGSSPDIEREEDIKPIDITANSPEHEHVRLEDIKSDISSMFETWSGWRKPYESMWNQIYRLYFSLVEPSKTPTRARIFVPIVFQTIEAAVPKIINIIFGQEKFWEPAPINKADQPQCDVVELLINYQLMQANFFVKFLDFTKQLALYGTSYFLVYWRTTRKWVFTRTPTRMHSLMGFKFGKITSWNEKKEYKVVYRGPDLEVVDILDVFPDPNSVNETSGKGFFIRSYIDLGELRELGKGKYPVYANVDAEELKEKQIDIDTSRSDRMSVPGSQKNVKVG